MEMTTSTSNAATLTYTIAPHPFSYKNVFDALLSFLPPNQSGKEKTKRWFTSLLRSAEQQRVQRSVGNFTEKFSRQLEIASIHVLMSATCSILSYGQPVNGMLWATSNGLYFRSYALASNKDNNNNNNNNNRIQSNLESLDGEDSLSLDENKDIENWGDDASAIREFIPFKDIVALLPSLALPTKQDDPPYVMGIPNAIVTPNAMQVFTVSPKQIFQFVYIRGVTVVPPSSNPSSSNSSNSVNSKNGISPVLHQHEYNVIKEFHNSLDALVFCALVERLWEAQLKELKIPLLRDGVDYAKPH